MNQLIAIALGGATGAIARYGMTTGVHAILGRNFPFGTLAVNVLGSLLIGFLYVMLVERMSVSPEMRAILLIGFLGSFTTFSTFSLETLTLIEQAELVKAAINIIASVTLCLLATWVGLMIARSL